MKEEKAAAYSAPARFFFFFINIFLFLEEIFRIAVVTGK